MAVRSEAGTGVIVSLVVFVLTTVFLLILTIVFYAGQTGADEERAKAQTSLAKYVRPNQRNTDFIKQVEAKAGQEACGQPAAIALLSGVAGRGCVVGVEAVGETAALR